MIRPGEAIRLMHISWVLLRYGLDEIILATHLFRPVRFLRFLIPGYWLQHRRPAAERIRLALEALGPVYIKFGQILSTRRDLLPDDIADELARLQDRVPPFDGELARQIIEKSWQIPLDQVLRNFDSTPLASASIAQVHSAELQDGKEVVVKVLRPGIEKIIRRDVALLFTIARLAQKYWGDGRRLRPVEVVEEYEKTIFDELDLAREAANASQLRHNFSDSTQLYVPEIFWDLTRSNIMVMERIYGIPVGQVGRLKEAGISMKQLAEQGVEIFFTQVFRDNFFHADMHPGNIFVERKSGRYIAVDFGIMGTLTSEDQRYLAENFLAFFKRDYRRVAELHLESGWVPADTRVDEFETAIRTVSEPIFEKPLSEISFGHFLLKLFQTARRFDMEIQPQLVLLQKTLLNIEGLGRQLYPQLDLWTTAKPFLERWMAEQVSPVSFLKRLRAQIPNWSEQWPELPDQLYRVLKSANEGRLEIRWQSDELAQLKTNMRIQHRNLVTTISGATLTFTGGISYTLISLSQTTLVWLAPAALSIAGLGAGVLLYSLFHTRD